MHDTRTDNPPDSDAASHPAPRVGGTHTVEQRFDRSVRLSTHWLRLRPAPQAKAHISAYSLRVHARPHFLNWVRDPQGNYLARLDLPEPIRSLKLTVEFIAELEPVNPFAFLTDPSALEHPFEYPPLLRSELSPYLSTEQVGPRLRDWLDEIGHGTMSTVERLTRVNAKMQAALALTPATSLRPADPEVVLGRGSGSCWDLAWLLSISLRHLGLAARLACGHRILLSGGAASEGSLAHASASLHCWSEVFVPGAGWLGLDPTSGLFTTETYIPLACAPDPLRVAPIVGFREACGEEQTERIHVKRLIPSTRPEPATDWADVRALGRLVERDLGRLGIQTSLGTGLSLVSRVASGAPEWNVAALGPDKRSAAEALLARLHGRLAPTGVLQQSQTEWFAGDALPRWQLGCYFRRDGQPVWRDPAQLGLHPSSHAERPVARAEAGRFAGAVATALGISADWLLPAYEDPLSALLKGDRAPQLSPSAEQLADPDARRALAERLSLGGDGPCGHVLPLARDHRADRWVSGSWRFRRSKLFLMPGTSPIGYRLPLASLMHDPEATREAHLERSPFEERGPLPRTRPQPDNRHDGPMPHAHDSPRTALCVQARGERLYVFLPPVSHVEHYLELVAAIEAATHAVGCTVVLEGYAPPEDHRLARIELAPDAGVLHVKLPELCRWDDQIDTLEAVYQEARDVGLAAERTTPDGRTAPAGGDTRLIVGGPHPAQSPFLRRPALLGALISYWQRHPCLSYFFSGRSLGPSGSSARPDEGRDEALYELSLGLDRLARSPGSTSEADAGTMTGAAPCWASWHADRSLRHLLTDLAGDLTRSEFRMDELYPPDRASKRLGRIQIGAFETAPNAHVAALQGLLVLGLLGHLAHRGERRPLLRFGPALHDRFMLPAILWKDLGEVIDDLNRSGYPFQLAWFEDLYARRFPVLGRVQMGEVSLELRAAHEPWPLLAEQAAPGGMARFIDVANERLQVRLTGLAPGRYALLCNGHRAPLRGTGTQGEYLAAVRYKVTDPPATLHPTVPPIEALVFDVVDLWSGRAIGGCTYVPARPLVWGPIDAPQWPGFRVPFPGDAAEAPPPRRPLPPDRPPPPVHRAGGFTPQGSGLGPMGTPPQGESERRPYLLDLTHR